MIVLAALALASAPPEFSVERGVYTAGFALELHGAPGDTLYYSLGSDAPHIPYTAPLAIDGTQIVRAIATGADGSVSEVVTHTYLFPADIVSQPGMDAGIAGSGDYGPTLLRTLAELPSVSLVTPTALTTTESEVSAEWIDPGGPDLQVECGAARTGTTSLGYPKNSLRLYFREAYGPASVDFDFWGDTQPGIAPSLRQDALSLRSGHDSVFWLGAQGQYTRNDWMDASQLAMGHTAPHGRFAHVYLDGEYLGLYHVRERFNAAFMADYLGGDEADYESINEGRINSGSGAAWSAIVGSVGDIPELKRWMQLDHYLDYMVLNDYAGNTWDWSAYHNWAAAGPSAPDAGGVRFYSSDSDICLYYGADVNALYLPGPADLFPALWAAGDPDFKVAWADAIHRNLEDGGPLTPEVAGERYATLAASIEDAVVAESARWGGGWWDRDGEWIPERDRLLNDWFPVRTAIVLDQLRAAGYYPLPAPEFSLPDGPVTAGDEVSVEVPEGVDAELWYTTDGSDPRLSGGAIATTALNADGVAVVDVPHGTDVLARLKQGDTWGPLGVRRFTVDEAAPVVLNEWNAVGAADSLDERGFAGSGADAAFGAVRGNGGAWFELVITEAVDLRGWRFELADLRGDAGSIQLTDAAALADMQPGTILTIAADLAEDASIDPAGGDWRLELTATPDGAYARSTGFRVSAQGWTFLARDADGHVRFGPAGEGIAPRRGISGHEVGALLADPSAGTPAESEDYGATTASTYGAPNVWDGGAQDLEGLRGEGTVLVEADTAVGPGAAIDSSAGCASAAAPPWLGLLALAFVLGACTTRSPSTPVDDRTCFADRDGDAHGDPLTAVRCDVGIALGDDCDDLDATVHPEAPERCDGADEDCDGVADDDPVDPLPFFGDADGDGFGAEDALLHACTAPVASALVGGDCDDADADVHPGAAETCDPVDHDCDGVVSTGLGAAAGCPAASCAAILADAPSAADGAYWLEQPSGSVVQTWCDMGTGGWTLVFSRNTASTGSQGDFGAGEVGTDAVATSPEAASVASAPALGWVDVESLGWTSLRLTAAYQGSRSYTSRDIPRSDLRIPFGSPGYLLYGEGGYYWCGGPSSYTDAGIGAVDNPDGAPTDCKGHGSLGSGWDFSESTYGNAGLTLCGGDGSYFLAATWGGTWSYYGSTGGAQAMWVR